MKTILDLFSGIGGFSLGFERTKEFQTKAFCEIDLYSRSVLSRRWPNVPIHGDISQTNFKPYLGKIDVICGGFPCQDISKNGLGKGLKGERSGLWSEYLRVIEEVQPSWVVIENVSLLRARGLGSVLRSLDEIGYVGEWHVISGYPFGALHERERLWIIAHTKGIRVERLWPQGLQVALSLVDQILPLRSSDGKWEIEPDLCRTTNGLSNWMDRIKCLGNAVIPQIAELIAQAILRVPCTSYPSSLRSE